MQREQRLGKILDYYKFCEDDYRSNWHLDQCQAMHLGFWDEETSSIVEALDKQNQVLAEIAKVKSTDYVLDAGCGVGGSSIYLAKKYGCHVVGITVSEGQVHQASKYALEKDVNPRPIFKKMDYTRTDFESEKFDVILAIESVCHEEEKLDFIKEAFRLLKKGGRLIVADIFSSEKKKCSDDKKMIRGLENSWADASYITSSLFEKKLKVSGFSSVTYRNVTQSVMPSSERLFHLAYGMSYPAFLDFKQTTNPKFNFQLKNQQSTFYLYYCFLFDLIEYGVMYAEKW